MLFRSKELKEDNTGFLRGLDLEEPSVEILELIKNINDIKYGYTTVVEEKLRQEKAKTELVSNVSHDLRTPLTSIINYVNILLQSDITDEERNEYLQIVDKKSKRLKILIDDLFEMSKINSGKIKMEIEKIDIVSLMHQVIGEYTDMYLDKNLQFSFDWDDEEIYMMLDGKLISRVIGNLCINALKYSLENTRIYISIEQTYNEKIIISFKNIANYEMEFSNDEMFERFSRGDKSRNSNIEGSGLGLAITKSIIELHGGNVNIECEGDMFKVYIILPINL